MSAPPDLRVLYRKLTAAAPAELPALCPSLVHHILRSGASFSTSPEQQKQLKQLKQLHQQQHKTADEAVALAHKVKVHINTLLHGKTAHGRFVGMVLAKAVVDVGGWECLRTAEPWVRGLLLILQKPDPFAAKEICVAVLARLYTLLQSYPTLVREIVTPTLPAFSTACLQLLSSTGKLARHPPTSLVEAVLRAFAVLVPLYPTTLRPFAVQIHAAVRPYIAPTPSAVSSSASSENAPAAVPYSIRHCARRLLVLLSFTAPKNGSADEWAKLLSSLVQDAHVTADQVFRAIRESIDPAATYIPGGHAAAASAEGPGRVSQEDEAARPPHGGGSGSGSSSSLDLPEWTGLAAGAERLVGLLATIAVCFQCPTKGPVSVPLGLVGDLVRRLSLVLPPPSVSASAAGPAADREFAALLNPVISREEREELWSVLPSIHVATVELQQSIQQRLGSLGSSLVLPLACEMLEDAVRMFAAHFRTAPEMRQAAYGLVCGLLPLVGEALPRSTVDAACVVLRACCHDLLQTAGSLAPAASSSTGNDKAMAAPQNRLATNADLFLTVGSPNGIAGSPGPAGPAASTVLEPAHLQAAQTLLVSLLSDLPQQHVRKADRALLDRTAILCASKDAMLASVLHPYIDRSGRYFASTIPFLARAYPHDLGLEVLRSNLRTEPYHYGNILSSVAIAEPEDAGDDDDDTLADPRQQDVLMQDDCSSADAAAPSPDAASAAVSLSNGFGLHTAFAEPAQPAQSAPASLLDRPLPGDSSHQAEVVMQPLTLKRKTDDTDEISANASKRLDVRQTAVMDSTIDDEDSDGSVQLDMVFDGEEDSEGES